LKEGRGCEVPHVSYAAIRLVSLGVSAAPDELVTCMPVPKDSQPVYLLAVRTVDHAHHHRCEVRTENRVAVNSTLVVKKPVVASCNNQSHQYELAYVSSPKSRPNSPRKTRGWL
jgi:hypothetical protein